MLLRAALLIPKKTGIGMSSGESVPPQVAWPASPDGARTLIYNLI